MKLRQLVRESVSQSEREREGGRELRNNDKTEGDPACIKTLGSRPSVSGDVAVGFSWRKFIKLSLDNFLPFSLLPFQLKKYSPQKFED